jgi:DNA polymerase-1
MTAQAVGTSTLITVAPVASATGTVSIVGSSGQDVLIGDINSRNITMRGFAERNAINAPLQGSAADLIKVAMIHVHDWMKKENLKSKMILQVHDELVFDAHKDEVELLKKNIPGLMSNAIPLPVPIEVEVGVGTDWLQAH